MHYHLKTGGVTTVLKQQIEAILNDCEVLVLTGEPIKHPFPAETVVIPGIGYDKPSDEIKDPGKIAASIAKAIKSKWRNGCDVLHVHNPTLEKNKSFLNVLTCLQQFNLKLFLQIHDFAEDGRPKSYSRDEYVSNAHYGVINSRDYKILLNAGLKQEGLHKIFNTVKSFNSEQQPTSDSNLVLYPIRALRRKNVGEAVLLSLFFENDETLAITLPPNSPADIQSYEGWKLFVHRMNLNVEFDSGLHNDFETLVFSSKYHITTSITEGFGFSFLEPWTAGKLLYGRKLPKICSDFEKNGIQLDHLYSSISIPIEWIGKRAFYEKWQTCILKNYKLFDRTLNEQVLTKKFEALTKNNTIDFGMLNERFQKIIIAHILSDERYLEILIHINPFLKNPGSIDHKDEIIIKNREIVLQKYSLESYRKNLLDIYGHVIKNSIQHTINKDNLLSSFLNPLTFSLLKWEDYDE